MKIIEEKRIRLALRFIFRFGHQHHHHNHNHLKQQRQHQRAMATSFTSPELPEPLSSHNNNHAFRKVTTRKTELNEEKTKRMK